MKLSPIQSNVIDALMKDGSYLHESRLYHWSKVICNRDIVIMSIHKPTVNFLKKNEFIIPVIGSNDRYVLNPRYTQNEKK